jgi:hypothetical protein
MATMRIDKKPTGKVMLVFNDGEVELDVTDFRHTPLLDDGELGFVLVPKTKHSTLDMRQLGVPEIITKAVYLESSDEKVQLWFIPEDESSPLLSYCESDNSELKGVHPYILNISSSAN